MPKCGNGQELFCKVGVFPSTWGVEEMRLKQYGSRIDFFKFIYLLGGFPDGSVGKEPACNAGDTGEWVRSLGQEDSLEEENGNPLQYSCLKNPMDREAWWATV